MRTRRQPTERALKARPLSIDVRMTKSESGFVELLNLLARHNARLLLERQDLPFLYDSGVFYQREQRETWCDFLAMLEQGWEDCDGLAAARAGELMAWGADALTPIDGGHDQALRLGLESIPAWVLLRTKGLKGERNLYHCVVLYKVGDTFWRDDPSARLGMFERRYHPYAGEPALPVGPASISASTGWSPRSSRLCG